jgi:prephenate dehydrogenase
MAPPFRRIGIAGLGLIGGSIARGVRARWPDTHLIGVDTPDVVDAARSAGVVHDTRASVQALTDVELVVLAAPVPVIIESIAELGSVPFDGIVMDVGSTKRSILAAAETAGLERFVGSHPMAGSERGGFDQSRPDLFLDRPWFIVPPANGSRSDDQLAVDQLVRALGAMPVHVDATTHDRTVAYVSHLPQLLSVALMNTAADGCGDDGLQHTGRGFADMTRLAQSPAELWKGIVDSNRDCISDAARELMTHLEALLDPDTRKLDAAFAQAQTGQRTV